MQKRTKEVKRIQNLNPANLLDGLSLPFGKLNKLPPWRGLEPRHLTRKKLYRTARYVASVSKGHRPQAPKEIVELSKEPYVRVLLGDMKPWYRFFESAYRSVKELDVDYIRHAVVQTRSCIAKTDSYGPKNLGFNYWLFFRTFLKDNLKKLQKFCDFTRLSLNEAVFAATCSDSDLAAHFVRRVA